MTDELVACFEGREIGRIRRHTRGRLTFTYDDTWRNADGNFPLSLSMPLTAAAHGAGSVEPFLWGLLPDSERVLDGWARQFHVSARDVFGLLANVGEDCAGAAQFVPTDRIGKVQAGSLDGIEWLDDRQLADRLKLLREDHAAWRLPGDTGQFSLAGAQPKTALIFEDNRWGIPSGRLPTTHILKPPTGGFDGHAENEHVCLALARALGMPAADSRVVRFQKETAIVIERYDRVRINNKIARVHQEDMCQALGVLPTRKYQNDGGPGLKEIVELLRTYSSASSDDVRTFIDATCFNWLIAGTDAHAKNYALLLGGQGRVRLAPLYDVASILPYDHLDHNRAKMPMKIGGEYRLRDIGIRQWVKLARDLRLDGSDLVDRLREMATRLPDAVADIRKATRRDGLNQRVVSQLEDRLIDRARKCARLLEMKTGTAHGA